MSLPAIQSNPSGTTRNDFSPLVGFAFIPSVDIYVKSLGRWMISGNNQTHNIYISDGSIALASVSLDLSAGTPGSYNYVSLGSVLHLIAGATYFCASQEFVGGDLWYEAQTYTGDANLSIGRCYGDMWSFSYVTFGTDPYVPPNFLFDLTPPSSGSVPLLDRGMSGGFREQILAGGMLP